MSVSFAQNCLDSVRPRLSNSGVASLHSKSVKRLTAIDYLSFWVYGEWTFEDRVKMIDKNTAAMTFDNEGNAVPKKEFVSELLADLEERKALAQTVRNDVGYTRNGLEFIVSPVGGGTGSRYREFQLHHKGIYFGICKNDDAEKGPQLKVDLKGDVCTKLSMSQFVEVIQEVFDALGFKYSKSEISRVDLRADLIGVKPLDFFKLWQNGQEVCSPRKHPTTFGDSFEDLETFQVGLKSSPCCCRMYDKLVESSGGYAQHKLEKYILGGEVVDSLCRVEFEVKRKFLKQRKIDSVEDLFFGMKTLTDHLTREWLRYGDSKIDKKNRHHDRVGTHELWQRVQSAFDDFSGTFHQEELNVIESDETCAEKTKNVAGGYLTSVMFKLRFIPETMSDVCEFFMREMAGYASGIADIRAKLAEKEMKRQKREFDRRERECDKRERLLEEYMNSVNVTVGQGAFEFEAA